MKKQIICMCIIFSMIFSGCMVSDVRTSENNTQIESEEDTSNMQTKNENDDDDEEDAVSFGYDETDESAAMDTYVYTGDALSVPYHLQAQKATGHDVGFLIFIDGVCQKYSVKEDTGEVTEEEYMHRFTLSDTNEKKFTFLIQPNIGKKGDKKGIYVCGIIYPGFQPEVKLSHHINIMEIFFRLYHSRSDLKLIQIIKRNNRRYIHPMEKKFRRKLKIHMKHYLV